jgi:hypothetical protein
MEKLLYQLKELRKKQQNDNFHNWLNKKVEDSQDAFTNKDVVKNYIYELTEFLKYNNYKIKDSKQFKDEIASYIYNNSY